MRLDVHGSRDEERLRVLARVACLRCMARQGHIHNSESDDHHTMGKGRRSGSTFGIHKRERTAPKRGATCTGGYIKVSRAAFKEMRAVILNL